MLSNVYKHIRPLTTFFLLSFFLGMANPTYAQDSSTSSGPFSVGQCWQVDVAKNVPSPFWNGSAPVNCSKPHNGYTYAVVVLPANYPDPNKTKYSTQEQSIIDKFWAKHPPAVFSAIPTRRQGAVYYPTPAQWRAGQRWFRYDLGLAAFGSPYSPYNKVNWAPLPTDIKTLIAGLKQGLPEFKVCTNTPKTDDNPVALTAAWTDCRGNPMHRLLGSTDIATSTGEKFPGAKIASQRADNFCRTFVKQNEVVISYSAGFDAVGWNQGNHEVWCFQQIETISSAGPYSVGQCWKVDESKNLPSNYWNGSAPVSCLSTHNAYTFGYWSLTKDIKSVPKRGSSIDNSIRDGCVAGVAGLDLPNNRLTTVVYYPSPKQWSAGNRNYRCDVGLYQIGSLASNPKWAPLPTDIKKLFSDLTKKSLLYQMCFTSSNPALLPPNDVKAVYANCTGKHTYRYLGAVNLAKKLKEPYPGDKVISSRGVPACTALAPNMASTSFQGLSQSEWEAGNTSIFCWQVSK